MKKLLLALCLVASPVFAQESPQEVADQTALVFELRLCPDDPKARVLIFMFNKDGQRIEMDKDSLTVAFNRQVLGLVLANKSITHVLQYVNKTCGTSI